MNKTLLNFARKEIKEGLVKCSKKQRIVFRKLYSHGNLGLPIDEIVDNIDDLHLDWAMKQVENTIRENIAKKNNKNETLQNNNTD